MYVINVVPSTGSDLPGLSYEPDTVPDPGSGEVRLRVAAAGVNPADVLQRRGLYPPPPGASPVLGLEIAGVISELGPGVTGWRVGQRVAALLDGGGYAQFAVAPVAHLLEVPQWLSDDDAASLPEALCTAWSNLVDVGGLTAGDTALIHGGSGGVGVIAVQLALALGARVVTTAGGAERVDRVQALAPAGTADRLTVVDYRCEDFVDRVREVTGGAGADVILDVVGGAYLEQNVRALATQGRLVVIGLQKGAKGELNLGELLAKRGSVHATTLRARPAAQKAEIVAQMREHAWPLVLNGTIRPVIHTRLPMAEAERAHTVLRQESPFGKIVLNP